jgi:hypothetical protein
VAAPDCQARQSKAGPPPIPVADGVADPSTVPSMPGFVTICVSGHFDGGGVELCAPGTVWLAVRGKE